MPGVIEIAPDVNSRSPARFSMIAERGCADIGRRPSAEINSPLLSLPYPFPGYHSGNHGRFYPKHDVGEPVIEEYLAKAQIVSA